jgi:ATP-dependent DNA helicase RecQ
VLAYRAQDLGMQRFFAAGRPDPDTVSQVARRLKAHHSPVSPSELREETRLTASRLTAVVNLLEQVEAVRTTAAGELEPVDGVSAADAARQAVELGDAHQQLERSRVDMMRGYAETTGCRRRFLMGYFGQAQDGACGNCDLCESGTVDVMRPAETEKHPNPFAPGTQVRHGRWGNGAVMSEDDGRLTVLFESVGYRTLSLAVVLQHDLLSTPREA